MRLSVIKHKAFNHAASPWLVVVPRRLSSTGKRQFHYFATRTAAEVYAATLRRRVREQGEQPVVPPASELAEARLAASLLEGSGLSLVQAVLLACQLKGRGGGEEFALPHGRLRSLESVFREMHERKAHQSLYTLRSRAVRFRTFFRRNAGLARRPMALLTAQDIEQALNRAWPAAPTSWNAMLTHLVALFNYAVRKGVLVSNPLGAIDRRHVAEKEIMPLSPAVLRALLLACRPPDAGERAAARGLSGSRRQEMLADTSSLAAYIAIAAFAGIRPTEATRLKWGDINLEDGCLSVRRAASKTGGTRHVELHPALRAWLEPLRPEAQPPGELLFRAGSVLARHLRIVRRRAGFGVGNPWPEDALRHSYASYYLKAGGSLERLQLNMGHAGTSLIYGRYCNMVGLTHRMADEWWGLTPAALRQSSHASSLLPRRG